MLRDGIWNTFVLSSCLSVYHVSAASAETRVEHCTLELESQNGVWVLVIKPTFSRRAPSALNHWGTFPALLLMFKKWMHTYSHIYILHRNKHLSRTKRNFSRIITFNEFQIWIGIYTCTRCIRFLDFPAELKAYFSNSVPSLPPYFWWWKYAICVGCLFCFNNMYFAGGTWLYSTNILVSKTFTLQRAISTPCLLWTALINKGI